MKAKTLTYIKKNPGVTTLQMIKDIYTSSSQSFIYREVKSLVEEGLIVKDGSALYPFDYDIPPKENAPSILDHNVISFPIPEGLKIRDLINISFGKTPLLDFKVDNPEEQNLTKAFMSSVMNLIYTMKLRGSVNEIPWLKALLEENERVKNND